MGSTHHIFPLRLWLVAVLCFALLGCQSLRPTPLVSVGQTGSPTTIQSVMDASVQGRVDFTSGRSTQAAPADVVNAATVSFIDLTTNQTVVAGKTDAAGSFTLSMGGYQPVNGATYLLEAVKGLNAQAPGSNAARFRTILKWTGAAWLSCSNDSVPGTVVINALTTALAIETALDPTHVPPSDTIGKVDVSTTPATLEATPTYTNHPNSEIQQLAADLLSYLGVDADPLASVPSLVPSIASFTPTSGGGNSLVRIQGSGFSPVPSGNTVTFNGTSAQVLLATPTSLVVVVPAGATSGTIQVQTGRGTVTTGSAFTLTTGWIGGGGNGGGGLMIEGFAPAYGRADAAVTLTGAFGTGTATPTVSFEGPNDQRVQARVTAWTATVMTVAVPIGAVPGSIEVQTGIAMAASPSSFDVRQGDVSLMNNLTTTAAGTGYTLPAVVHAASDARWGDYYYLIGGQGSSAATTYRDVRMVPLNPDGSLGTIRTVGQLITGRYWQTSAVWGNYLYVFGGTTTAGAHLSSIERAPITPDGTLGAFVNIGNLQGERGSGPRAVVRGDTLYVLGGYRTAGLNTAERYAINPATGDLTYVATYTMTAGGTPFTNRGFGCALVGSGIVMVGGYLNESYGNDYRSITIPIKEDGSLGNGTYGPNMGVNLYATQCAVYDNELYVMSGYHNNGTDYYYATVLHAPLDPVTGAITGPFVTTSSQVYSAAWGVCTIKGNRLYTFGGYNGGTHGVIQTATINPDTSVNPDKSVSPWSKLGAVTSARHGFAGQMLKDKAWLVGGYSYTSGGTQKTTEYVTVRDDGSIGPSTMGPALKIPRSWATSFAASGFLYVVGGYENATGAVWNTIERAKINDDGTLGSFIELPVTLNMGRYTHYSAIIGKYVYVFGGQNGAVIRSIERAVINADGSLGRFELLNATLPEVRSSLGMEVVGDYVYMVGGHTSGPTAHVYSAPINPDGSIGSFTRGPSMNYAVYSPSVARIGNYLYCFGGWNTSAYSLVQRTLIKPDGTLNVWENYQPGGRDVLPSGSSHWNVPPYVYKDALLLFSGYVGDSVNIDAIFQGTIR